jgi:putative DNA primase/helicase
MITYYKWQVSLHLSFLFNEIKVINLKTGISRVRCMDDKFSISLNVDIVDEFPLAIEFVNSLFGGDQEMVEYMRYLIGYCFTAEVTERSLYIAWGKGRNGKSTLFNVINLILGNKYFVSLSERVLEKDVKGATSPELESMIGA